MPKITVVLPERFWAKTRTENTGYETPCLTWTASTMLGYGRFRWGGGTVLAHRLAYEARFGDIPKRIDGDRAVIDHLCRNRACVNVDHMELVTNRINILRGDTIQAAYAARTHCINGHEWTPENTSRHGKYGNRACRACRRERQRIKGERKPRALKSHCKRGHEFTEENIYVKPSGKRECRTCLSEQRSARTEREREARGPVVERARCNQGHEYTPENTYRSPNGKRRCRECMREYDRRSKARKKRGGS